MPVQSFARMRRITIPVGDEQVILILREPTSKERSDFLTARFQVQGRKVKSHVSEARARFIRPLLLEIENAEYENADGVFVPLNSKVTLSETDKSSVGLVLGAPVNDWRDLVNVTWLSSAAMAYEDAAPETEGGN